MKHKKINNKGLSLAITVGLLLLLMIIVATLMQLVIRSLRASHDIEASDKAYFAAEAGLEDALYELSPHLAGYQTPALGSADVRSERYAEEANWRSEWELSSKDLSPCLEADWSAPFTPNLCGKLYGGEKLIINLFNDVTPGNGVKVNEVNTAPTAIDTLSVSSLELRFRLPKNLVLDNGLTALLVDNDGDFNVNNGEGLNEDGAVGFDPEYEPNTCDYSDGIAVDDDDCDQREDEDSPEDPVFLWKVIDDQGRFFQPLRGCKDDNPEHPSHSGFANAGLCEKNFVLQDNAELSVSLNEQDLGLNQAGETESLLDFISETPAGSQLKMEVLLIAPMSTFDLFKPLDQQQITIPYYEYGLQYTAGNQTVPASFFSLRSDGYFRDFKQSISTKVMPGTVSTLLDLTIIQQ